MKIQNGNIFLDVSERGATVTTLQWLDRHIIFQPQIVYVDGRPKLRGGIPIPCPWFGPGKYEDQPQHGFVRDTLMKDINEYFHSMGMRWRAGEVGCPKDMFNGSFDFYASFALRPRGLQQTVTFTRIGSDPLSPLPLNMGFHPYFYLPQGEATVELQGETYSLGEDNVKDYAKSLIIPGAASPATITVPGLGKITMIAGGNLVSDKAATVIWTDSSKYLCVEPVLTSPAAYATSDGFHLDRPGDKCEIWMNLDFVPV